jgi:hypothetical protein
VRDRGPRSPRRRGEASGGEIDDGAHAGGTGWLREWFGWRDAVELGGIASARGTEMYLPLWVRLYGSFGTPRFSIRVVR